MMKPPEIVETYVAAYNARDVDGMVDCLTDDIHFQNRANGTVNAQTHDRQEFADLARLGVSAFAERRQTITNSITVMDMTLVEIEFIATVATDLPNGWKTGQKLAFTGASAFRLRDGKICSIVDES